MNIEVLVILALKQYSELGLRSRTIISHYDCFLIVHTFKSGFSGLTFIPNQLGMIAQFFQACNERQCGVMADITLGSFQFPDFLVHVFYESLVNSLL
jgi:hypothetical protein